MGFAAACARARPEQLSAFTRLTEVFYEIRFGGHDLNDEIQSRIRDDYRRLQEGLRNGKGRKRR